MKTSRRMTKYIHKMNLINCTNDATIIIIKYITSIKCVIKITRERRRETRVKTEREGVNREREGVNRESERERDREREEVSRERESEMG